MNSFQERLLNEKLGSAVKIKNGIPAFGKHKDIREFIDYCLGIGKNWESELRLYLKNESPDSISQIINYFRRNPLN